MANELYENQKRLAESQQDIVNQMNRLSAEQTRMINSETMRNAKELLAHTYASANAYTNLIIAAGYVGFFTLWSSLIDKISMWAIASSGALILISLLTFISFELYKMVSKALAIKQLHGKLQNPHANTLEDLRDMEKKYALKHSKIWIWFLVPIVSTGLLAGLVLLTAFIIEFVGLYLISNT